MAYLKQRELPESTASRQKLHLLQMFFPFSKGGSLGGSSSPQGEHLVHTGPIKTTHIKTQLEFCPDLNHVTNLPGKLLSTFKSTSRPATIRNALCPGDTKTLLPVLVTVIITVIQPDMQRARKQSYVAPQE